MSTDWADRRAAELRSFVREVACQDPELKKRLGRSKLPVLGYGSASFVFGLGRRHVLRVSAAEDLAPDCAVPKLLLEDYGGVHVGWPRVDDVLFVDEGGTPRCIVIAERVRVEDKIPGRDWSPLLDAVDMVVWHHGRHRGKLRFEEMTFDSNKSGAWAQQLYDGLVGVGRWEGLLEIDDLGGNFGLTRDGDAVWVDFGV